MTQSHFSIILIPTLGCNADCEYCFEDKAGRHLTLDRLGVLMEKVMDFLEQKHIGRLSIYWQGGEVLTLPPEWFEQANTIIRRSSEACKKEVVNYLQSNMIGYSRRWNRIISEMFGDSVGSSMDFPNLHRRVKGGTPEEFERLWVQNVREAIEAGIKISVIAIPNEKTLRMGARSFYSYFADEVGITEFQVNTPFPGGTSNRVKDGYPLDAERLSRFLSDLAALWVDRGFGQGVHAGPFDKLMEYFVHGQKNLLCIWRANCVDDFVCFDPQGNVSQCDCWAASYPMFRYGDIFGSDSLYDILEKSEVRRRFMARPGVLIQGEDCLECRYLGICHGGCPVRAYTMQGDLNSKDPYCPVYLALFDRMERLALMVNGHSGSF